MFLLRRYFVDTSTDLCFIYTSTRAGASEPALACMLTYVRNYRRRYDGTSDGAYSPIGTRILNDQWLASKPCSRISAITSCIFKSQTAFAGSDNSSCA